MKILVVDDHPLVGEAMQHVLRRLDPDAEVLIATRCIAAFEIAAKTPELDLVLLDLNLPDQLSGIPALREWRRRLPAVPVVVISASEERTAVLAALDAGAAGFIPKSSPSDVMLPALELVLAGGKYVPPQAVCADSQRDRTRARRRSVDTIESLGLTERQRDVLRLIAQGKPNKLICRELGLAERTVKAHVTAVFRALKVTSRTQAALAAARLGIGASKTPD
ncbi:MAG: response regulator transcription factor [Gemmatimonadota bacterium]